MPEPHIHAELMVATQEILDIARGNQKHLIRINGDMEANGKRLEKLEWEQQREAGRQEIRDKHVSSLRWWFVSGMTLAGLLSGVVFAIADRV